MTVDSNQVVRINAHSPDPTNSRTLRRNFARDFRGRWRTVRGENRRYLRDLDLAGPAHELTARYRRWVDGAVGASVVEPTNHAMVERGQHWTGTYVRQAYQKGLRLAERDLERAGYPSDAIDAATRVNEREHRLNQRGEYLGAYFELEDTADAIRRRLTRELMGALDDGESKQGTVERLQATIQSHGRNATNALANTSVVQTVNSALLTSYELTGVEQVGVQVESVGSPGVRENAVDRIRLNDAGELSWETAMDARVCDDCLALEGRIMTVKEVKDNSVLQPPIHPNCRCRWVPMPMGDS